MFLKYCAILGVLLLAACASVPEKITPTLSPEEEALVAERLPLVRELQAFEQEFGLQPTENFHSYDPALKSYMLCYRAGVFWLEGSVASVTSEACDVAKDVLDAFLYPAQALATIKTPITASLLHTKDARFIMVVFHEDFHEQMIGVPSWTINESATTLMGLLYAREYMRAKHGEGSPAHREISSNIEQYLEIARIELRYEQAFTQLYRQFWLGKRSREQTLEEKAKLFAAMHSDCVTLRPSVMKSCATLANNAELSYELVYTRHFALFHDLYLSCGEDVRKTGLILSGLAHEKLSEDDFLHRTTMLIRNRCTS